MAIQGLVIVFFYKQLPPGHPRVAGVHAVAHAKEGSNKEHICAEMGTIFSRHRCRK